ncbi:MAG: methanogenesis marker 17 protein [Candidatus Bathyarchaeota archaeon]|nr:methanogenesis marker 17 protein [Candidatus Bathyarchaeota archaeon]
MKIIVECEDIVGAKLYEEIIKEKLRVCRTPFKKIHMFIDVKTPLSITCVSWLEKPSLTLSKMAEIEACPEGAKVVLKEDFKNSVDEIRRFLRVAYGEENIEVRNYSIIVKDAKPQDLESLFIPSSFTEDINAILNFLRRILPEGFRIYRVLRKNDKLALIASEDTIKDEWTKKAEQILSGEN